VRRGNSADESASDERSRESLAWRQFAGEATRARSVLKPEDPTAIDSGKFCPLDATTSKARLRYLPSP
jgi:hypothetical protein